METNRNFENERISALINNILAILQSHYIKHIDLVNSMQKEQPHQAHVYYMQTEGLTCFLFTL